MIDEPENRAEIEASLLPLYSALAVAPAAVSTKAALRLLGLPAGTVRLPYVDLTDHQEATLRTALSEQGLLQEVSS
jgi:4-hydroxy-tetrahydrodipicolinate synthase